MKEYMKKYLKYYLIIIFIALIMTSGLLVKGLPNGHDLNAHMARAIGTAASLKEGQIPPLIVSNYANGLGYSWNLFYPPLAPYLMTVLRIFVFSYANALKLLIIIFLWISGMAMFKLIEEITKNKNVSLLGAIIYMCSPYILTDIYVRMAVGEILSYALLPILFLGLHNLFNGNGKKHTLITIGAVGIMLSHNISTLFAVGLSVIYVLFNLKKLNNIEIWKKIIANVVFILLLVVFFYLPLLQAKNDTDYSAFDYGRMGSIEYLEDHAVYISQILFGKLQAGASVPMTDEHNLNNDMCMQIGLFIIIPILFTPFIYKKISKKNRKNYLLTLIIGILAIFAATPLFPYDIMPKQIAIIQYPYRFLLIATFTLSIIATINIYKAFENINLKEIMVFTIIVVSYVQPLIFANPSYLNLNDADFQGNAEISMTTKTSLSTANFEYFPSKAFENLEYIKSRDQNVLVISGQIQIIEQNKNGSKMSISFKNANEKASIELPYIYYPGYEIEINDKKADYYESEKGLIEMDIPENTEGNINIRYTGTRLARITWIISLISLIIFIIYNIRLILRNKDGMRFLSDKLSKKENSK